ncbi:hypothetical protein AN958_01896 [Leucoagaricus sp. SymC.cos]|nr:hypothetical protein AN958_01896 [Leucoagaricus sp. SymC.cos]
MIECASPELAESNRAIPPLLHRVTAAFPFLFDTLPRYTYHYILLQIPALYSTRVTRIVEAAKPALTETKKVYKHEPGLSPDRTIITECKSSWTSFLGSLMAEWQTLNIVSTLLLSALLTVMQVDGAGNDPLTRSISITAMICALWSLVFGCIFIIRFGTMKRTHQGLEWCKETRKGAESILWNAWVLLAMPTVWLAWALILFATAVLSFIWPAGPITSFSGNASMSFSQLTSRSATGVRVAMTIVFVLGMIYLILIISTLRHYGSELDHKWKVRVDKWTQGGANGMTSEPEPSDKQISSITSPQRSSFQVKDDSQTKQVNNSAMIKQSPLPSQNPAKPE